MALLDGSPAIGAGDTFVCGTIDQRNLPIANDGDSGGCDIGAFEFYVAPFNKRPPRIHGTPTRGTHLRCSKGGWRGGTPIDYLYAWFRDSSKIQDYRRHTYRVRPTDIGHTLRCKITATNPGGETALKSKSVTARH
jgi:hypothetical protein